MSHPVLPDYWRNEILKAGFDQPETFTDREKAVAAFSMIQRLMNARATIHAMPAEMGLLPCCGLALGDCGPGDTMALIPGIVDCGI